MKGTTPFSLALLLAATLAAPAAAEDHSKNIVTSWAGFYGGVHVGAVDSQTSIRDEDGTVFDAEGGTFLTNDLSLSMGVHGGYNWQDGNKVFGIEADYTWTNAGRSRLFDGTDHYASSDLNGYGSLRGRAGLAVENAHIYLTGGIGYVDANVSGYDSLPDQIVSKDGFFSVVAGAGAEFKVRSDVSLRLEYLHHIFNEKSDLCNDCDEPQLFGGDLGIVRAGLTYHFGQDSEKIEYQDNDTWSGFYAGLHIGAVDSKTWVQDEDDDVLNEEGMSIFTNDLKASAGLHAGYNWMMGSALVGVEADYSWTNSGGPRNYDANRLFISSQIDGFASIRARVGLASGNALAYVTGGGALINAKISASDIGSAGENVSYDQFGAIVLGAGVEIKVTDRISVRGEYLNYAFDEKSTVCAGCFDNQPQLADGTLHTFRAGLSYYLNATGTGMPEVEAADWSGFYAGIHTGILNSSTGIRDDDGTIFDANGLTVITNSRDVSSGIHAGYNYQIQNAVFGFEVDYSLTNSGSTRFFNSNDHFISSEIEGYGSARGKVGLAAGDALFYATGGIGFVKAKLSGYDSIPTQVVDYENFVALVAGAGTEYKIKEDVSIRAEYLYYGFDEKSDLCTGCANDPAFADGELHILRVGLTKQF